MTSESYSVAAKGSLMNEAAFPPLPLSNLSLLAPKNPSHLPQGHVVLSNVPADIAVREATAIFLLVIDDVESVDVSEDHKVHAWFRNPSTAATAARMLDGRPIFGAVHGPVKADYDGQAAVLSMMGSLNLSNSSMQPPLSIQTNQAQLFGPESGSLATQAPPSSSHSFDAFPKRLSVGNQRSRFLFSDPFSAGSPASAGAQPPSQPSIDLSDITGKSLLLMESQSDARDYDNLVRDPWLSSGLPATSAPQTPGMSSSFDWSSNPTSSDRRRTSSAFFSGSSTIHPNLSNGGVMPMMQGLPSQFIENQQGQQGQPQLSQPSSATQPQAQAAPPQKPAAAAPSSAQPAQRQLVPSAQAAPLSSSIPAGGQSAAPSGQTLPSQPAQPSLGASLTRTKDMPDLSLLARVPPPANPADQNPPCNTLYVGNLPPDATEAELRALFLPQKGFRRLSFRTKNQSSTGPSSATSHNHGPMCFVEFEDVAHATRALAELYGRALPRPNGSNGKGGIRLSFSKNPLGVRGPGNPRRTSANQVPGSTGSSSNANGVGYSYQYQK